MSITGYIVIGIVILLVILCYVLLMFAYIGCSKSYKTAFRNDAVILEILEEMKLATGSIAPGKPQYKKFGKYKISMYIDGEEFIREAELKNRKLKEGDHVEVRYSYDKKGNLDLESEALVSWLRGMFWASTAGIILGVVLAILKHNDMIH